MVSGFTHCSHRQLSLVHMSRKIATVRWGSHLSHCLGLDIVRAPEIFQVRSIQRYSHDAQFLVVLRQRESLDVFPPDETVIVIVSSGSR